MEINLGEILLGFNFKRGKRQMRNEYKTPYILVVRIVNEEVLTTSGKLNNNGGGGEIGETGGEVFGG